MATGTHQKPPTGRGRSHLDEVLQAAASLTLLTDICGLALAVGLTSSLYSDPNDSAALTALALRAAVVKRHIEHGIGSRLNGRLRQCQGRVYSNLWG